jgi:hypothetical protein
MRVDPTDRGDYTWEDFEHFYGADAAKKWAAARPTPNRGQAAAKKAAAKLFCSYIFKELETDNHQGAADAGVGAAAGRAEAGWSRQGRRADPMIPSNAEAWPALRQHFGVVLRQWWGGKTTAAVVGRQVERLLGWCREGAAAVAHEVRPHGGTSAVLFSPLLVIRRTQSGFRSSSAE